MKTFRIVEAGWTERPVKMRLPFQFGSTEVRETAEAHARVVIEVDGKAQAGRSAQLMVPRWFDKRPEMSNADTIDVLRNVIRVAMAGAPGLSGSAQSLTRDVHAHIADALPDVPALARGFGPALLEMAVIDALCRAVDLPFWRAAKADLFGLARSAPDDLPPETIMRVLSKIAAPSRIALRHTIGFDAPLTSGDVGSDAPRDGQPVTLDEVISRTGITGFKIKLKGDPDADIARLHAVAEVLKNVTAFTVTLDANEQYSPETFAGFEHRFLKDPNCQPLRDATRFIEQPFGREIAFENPVNSAVPLVIDESDSSDDAFPNALALGWSGTSIKSCKGVLRALLNRVRAEASGAILSGEDLTCQPGLCWQQDTAMMAACGVLDVERNGHHFAGGLQGASDPERRYFLSAHDDIYEDTGNGIGLQIKNGMVHLGSLNVPGFGCETNKLPAIDTV